MINSPAREGGVTGRAICQNPAVTANTKQRRVLK